MSVSVLQSGILIESTRALLELLPKERPAADPLESSSVETPGLLLLYFYNGHAPDD